MLSKIVKLEGSREYFQKADKFNNNEAIDWFMKFTIEAFETLTDEVIRLQKKVKKLEQQNSYYPNEEEISSTGRVSLQALYYMPTKFRPDLTNLLQATCDILEKARVIENDKNIVSFDGSRIAGVDKANPRTEIIIEGR